MAFLMCALLAVFVIVAYFTGKKNLLSPWFLLCFMFFVTFLIVLFNYVNWEVKINGIFVLYVCTAIISFGLGGKLISRIMHSTSVNAQSSSKISVDDANLKRRYPIYFLLILSACLSVLYMHKLLSDAGAGSLSDKLRKIYDSIVENNYTPGFIYNQMREIVTAIAYINTYRLMIKLFSRKDKISVIALILPILNFIATVLVASDRNVFIRYAFYFICLYVLFFTENYKKKNANVKIIKRIAIMGIIAVVLFFLFGKMKQYSSDFVRSISIYGGSGLYNFNLWVKDYNEPLMYGNATFSTFLNSLKTILGYAGINLDVHTFNRFDVFIKFESANGYSYSSNIYSALKPYVEDFGYFGVILFPFIIGALFQLLFINAKKVKYNFAWLVYCMMIYSVLFFPIAEQFFGRFTLGFIYEIGWLSIFYFGIFGIKKRNGYVIRYGLVEGSAEWKTVK